MKHILIIDDDINIGNMLEEILSKEGYGVMRAYSGTEGLLLLKETKPDLILLDLMLPGLCGEAVLSQIKGIPVIVVSAKVDVDNKVDLLLGGAVDYVTKPFDTKELLARIAVQFRKMAECGDEGCKNETSSGGTYKDEMCLSYEDVRMDVKRHVVMVCNEEVKLTRTEYAILKMLMKNPTQVVTKTLLLERIAEDTPDCTDSSLKMHISNLRKKLRTISGKDYIEAVWGIGFKMKSE